MNSIVVVVVFRHSFQQARKFFGHLVTLRPKEPDVWLCLSVCCAMAEEFQECSVALQRAEVLVGDMDDMRIKFCRGEMIMMMMMMMMMLIGPALLSIMFHHLMAE